MANPTKEFTMKCKQDITQFIRSGGERCPFCGAPEVEMVEESEDTGSRYFETECRKCDRNWITVYQLDRVIVGHSDTHTTIIEKDGGVIH